MGMTAENLHDRYPSITKERADAYAVRVAGEGRQGVRRRQDPAGPGADGDPDGREGLGPGDRGRGAAPRHHAGDAGRAEDARSAPHGNVTAGNSSGINDGATGCLVAAEDVAGELGLTPKMRLVSYAFAGVEPEVMGVGPIPSTERALRLAGLSIDDIGLFEINEAFAVQVLAFLDHFGIADDDPRVNPYGGAIAFGHPLASSGVRLMTQLARQFGERPDVRYGITTMCVGMGMGGTVIWENLA